MRREWGAKSRLGKASTAGAWLHVLLRVLAANGHDGERLAIDAGVPLRSLRAPGERVPQLAMTQLWKRAVVATGKPSLGLDVARAVTGSTFGALTHLAFVSPTLDDAFRRVVRYQRLMTDSMQLEYGMVKGRSRLTAIPIAPDHPPAEELDAFFATWVRVARGLTSGGAEPVRIHLRREQPRDAALYKRVFRAPIRFRAAKDFVEYEREACERRLTDANLELAHEYERLVAAQAAQLEGATLAERVRATLLELMADGPTEAAVAARLHLSRSSLKAALAREVISYRTILEETRRALAHRYLRERGYSVKEVAFLLGYADASVFTRAFKRWTGETPARYAAGGEAQSASSSTERIKRRIG